MDRRSKKMTLKKFFFSSKEGGDGSGSPRDSSLSPRDSVVSPRVEGGEDSDGEGGSSSSSSPPTSVGFSRPMPAPRPLSERPLAPPRSGPSSSPPNTSPPSTLPPSASSPALTNIPFHRQAAAHQSQPISPLRRPPGSPLPDRPTNALPPLPPSKSTPPSTPFSGGAKSGPGPGGLTHSGSAGSVPLRPAAGSRAVPRKEETPPPPPEPVEEPSPEELVKMLERRTHIAKELLSTEQSYVRSLTVITNSYMTPLMQWVDTEKSEVSKAELKQIFSNIEMILSIHNEILSTLEERLAAWDASQFIGDIFMRIAPFLKMYNEYANNYNQAQDILAQKLVIREGKQNVFALKLYELEYASNESNPLPSLIIMPIQRIPRYNLLLADLLKNTPRSHADHLKISTALGKMADTAAYINNSIRETENNKKFLKLAAGNKGAKGLIAPHRMMLMETTFFDKQKKRPCYIWLFNDILIHMSETKAKNLKNLENPDYQWPLSLVWTNENVNYGDSTTTGLWFDLVGPMKAYSLRANTAADKQKFFTEIRSAVSKLGITVEEMERSGAYSISYGQMAGGKYDGTWLFGKFHGTGTFTQHGNTYEGDWDNNKRHGSGTLRYLTGETYEGHWKNNKQHGQGTVTYPNGDIFRGDWEDGLKSGRGDFVFANGDNYSGEWQAGSASGQGTLTSKHLIYTGGWNEDRFHGRGVLQHANGRKYEGEFVAGQKQGQGVLTYGNGDIYRGAFHHDMRHGQGVFVSEEGGYEGAWDNDTQHGYGKMVYSSEDSYDGHWVKGQRHGLGIMAYTSGSFLRYEGEWQYHQQTGKGNLDFRNGSRYEGMFKAGKFHGLGILTYPNGIRIEGKWAAGIFEGKMQVGKGKGRDPVVIFTGTWKDGIVVHEKTQFDLPPRQPLFNLFAKD